MVHPNNGWTIIDDNWKNHQIVTKNGLLYLHHNQDGRIYQFGGLRGEWQCIYNDRSTTTLMIAASATSLYVLLDNNNVLQWTGNGRNWTPLQQNSLLNDPNFGGIRSIQAAGFDPSSRFFALLGNGTVVQVKTANPGSGSPVSVDVTTLFSPPHPATTRITNGTPIHIAFAVTAHAEPGKHFVLYMLFTSGKIMQLLDVDNPLGWGLDSGETNWRVVDEDPKNGAIACAGEFLFFWRNDRTLWEYLGQTTPATAYTGPVVRKVDDNVWSLSVAGLDWPAGNGRRVVVVKSWGRIWERLT